MSKRGIRLTANGIQAEGAESDAFHTAFATISPVLHAYLQVRHFHVQVKLCGSRCCNLHYDTTVVPAVCGASIYLNCLFYLFCFVCVWGGGVFGGRAAITACGNGGNLDKSLDLLGEMRTRANLDPDVQTYNAAITACGRCGEWEKGVALLRQMPAAGVAPGRIRCGS